MPVILPSFRKPAFAVLLAVALLQVFVQTAAQCADFHASGTLVHTSYPLNKAPLSWAYEFSVTVRAEKWAIKAALSPTYYFSSSSDGQFTYEVNYQAADQVPPELRKLGGRGGCTASIDFAGPYPTNCLPVIKVLWLAFASSPFLDASTNSLMVPPWLATPTSDNPGAHRAHSYHYAVTRFVETPRLPKHINFNFSSNLFVQHIKQSKLRSEKRDSLLRQASSTAESISFDAPEATNTNEVAIPVTFRLDRFARFLDFQRPEGDTNRFREPYSTKGTNRLMESYSATVTSVSRSTESSFVLTLPQEAAVSMFDPRFRDQKYPGISLQYGFPSNAYWPPLGGADVQARLALARKWSDQQRQPSMGALSWLIISLLGLLTAFPLLVIHRRWQNGKKTHHTQRKLQ